MRRWQDSASSKPPPNAGPVKTATTGRPSVSSRRMRDLRNCTSATKASRSAGCTASNRFRSAPARNESLPERRMTPLIPSRSRSRRSRVLTKDSVKFALRVFTRWCGSSMVSVTTPSPSRFHLIASTMRALPPRFPCRCDHETNGWTSDILPSRLTTPHSVGSCQRRRRSPMTATPRLTADISALSDLVRDEFAPLVTTSTEGRVNRELYARIGERGVLDLLFPRGEDPRAQANAATICALREALAYGCIEAEVAAGMQGIGGYPVLQSGTPAHLARWLPGLRNGSVVAAFALTEPDVGSDAANLQLAAEADEIGRASC